MEKIEIILASGDTVNARVMFKKYPKKYGMMYCPTEKANVILTELLTKLNANDWRIVKGTK